MLALVGLSHVIHLKRASDPQGAVRAAEDMGFTEVRIEREHRIYWTRHGCGPGDAIAYDVAAKNPIGRPVKVVVCSQNFTNGKLLTVRGGSR